MSNTIVWLWGLSIWTDLLAEIMSGSGGHQKQGKEHKAASGKVVSDPSRGRRPRSRTDEEEEDPKKERRARPKKSPSRSRSRLRSRSRSKSRSKKLRRGRSKSRRSHSKSRRGRSKSRRIHSKRRSSSKRKGSSRRRRWSPDRRSGDWAIRRPVDSALSRWPIFPSTMKGPQSAALKDVTNVKLDDGSWTRL